MGQIELCINFDDVVKSLENIQVVRLLLMKHFQKRGLVASFIPKASEDLGTGAHAHLSLWK